MENDEHTMKEKATRKNVRESLTDQDKIRIVKERFAALRTSGNYKSLEDIGAEYGGRNKAVISRIIKEAFMRGLVEIRDRESNEPDRINSLEKELERRFSDLQEILVIKNEFEDKRSPETGDIIHQRLGEAMSTLIEPGTMFRPEDRIAISSGRGCYYCVRELERVMFRVQPVTILSLNGYAYVRDRRRLTNFYLDADAHVGLLGRSFIGKVTMKMLAQPIAHQSGSDAQRAWELIWPENSFEPPTHALVGAGAFTNGHCFYDEVKEKRANLANKHSNYVLDPIRGRLEEIKEICDKVGTESYCPVGDICMRLFYIPPDEGSKPDAETIERLIQLITEVNERLLILPEGELEKIGTIMLIAGMEEKAHAIHYFLNKYRKNIRFLCTDQSAAEAIIRINNRCSRKHFL